MGVDDDADLTTTTRNRLYLVRHVTSTERKAHTISLGRLHCGTLQVARSTAPICAVRTIRASAHIIRL